MDKGKQIPQLYELWEFKRKTAWTYDKIANYMGVHPQTIISWITGAQKPSSTSCEKIKKFLDTYFLK